eukprot:3562455-Lingulodinium_polyedra.AAC.1
MLTPEQQQLKAAAEDAVAEEDVATIPIENALSDHTFQAMETRPRRATSSPSLRRWPQHRSK